MTTKVSKNELIEVIKANREEHHRKYEEAIEAYWTKASEFSTYLSELVEKRDKRLLKLGAGGLGMVQVEAIASLFGIGKGPPAPPPCHLKDYDQALRMIEMHQEDTIVLQSGDFAKLVRDEWEWKSAFDSSYGSLIGSVG